MQKYILIKLLNLKKISVIILILALSINLLLDFSFIKNRLGKEFREFAYQYLVPFKNIGNLENKIEKLENKNRQNLEATIHVDQKNIID